MKSEDEPITADEWLIRLVFGDRVRPDRTPIISLSSFEPRSNEGTGISLFRRACLADPVDALGGIAEAKRDRYAIVQVRAALIYQLPCTLRIDPIPQVAGHLPVPEINHGAYKADKPRLQSWFLRLAHEASTQFLRHPLP